MDDNLWLGALEQGFNLGFIRNIDRFIHDCRLLVGMAFWITASGVDLAPGLFHEQADDVGAQKSATTCD